MRPLFCYNDIAMFNVIRIPWKFTRTLKRLSQEEKAESLDYLMEICSGHSVELPDSIVWDTIWLIYWEWMNMESKNWNKPKESLIIYTPESLGNKSATKSVARVEESIIEEKRIDTKDSNESKELALNKKNPEIDILITELKNKADELWIAYDKTKDRMFAKHITQAKEFWEFCEKIHLSPVDFAINIMIASDRIWFWKWTCSWPMKIYQNYSEVYNLIKTKKESSEIINIT